MTVLRLLCGLAALAPSLFAQQQKVLPQGMDFVEGPLVFTQPFGKTDAAIQLLYDADQVTLGLGVVTGMHFRQSQVTASQTYPGYTKNYRVTAYTVAASAATMSPDPLVNIGTATGTVVFQGPVTLPPVQVITTYPAPFGIDFAFTTPYPFDGSLGNLLFVVETADTNAVPTGSYRIDAVNFPFAQSTGLSANLDDSGCVVHGQSLAMTSDATTAVVGGSITQAISSSAAGAFPLAVPVLALDRAQQNASIFGMPTCTSWVGSPLAAALAPELTGGGYAPVVWPLPNDPSLEGIAVVNQALGIAASGAIADCVTSNGVGTRIGGATGPTRNMGMSFRSGTSWFTGTNGVFMAVVALDGVFP